MNQSTIEMTWPRADPAALANFDPRTKPCLMNCGPHTDDPRPDKERIFLCDDCPIYPARHVDQTNAGAEQRDAARLAHKSAYGVRNNQGYWVGIWNDREIAERMCGQGIHGERVVALIVVDEG